MSTLAALGPLPMATLSGRRFSTQAKDTVARSPFALGMTPRSASPTADAAFKRLLELDAACRSTKLGAQVKAVLEFEQLFRVCPFPQIVDTGFFKLLELFRASHNGLRYFILFTLYRLQPFMDRILNPSELVRRILAVVAMTDPLARVIALRTLGCLAPVVSDHLDVQHAIVKKMASPHTMEAAAAIHAADKLCQFSTSFPKVLWSTLVVLIESSGTPPTARNRLVSILRHMHHDPGLADEARALCQRWLKTSFGTNDFTLHVMKTAAYLACHTLVDVDILVDQFVGYLQDGSTTAHYSQPLMLWYTEMLRCLDHLLPQSLMVQMATGRVLLQWLVKCSIAQPDETTAQLVAHALYQWLDHPTCYTQSDSELAELRPLVSECLVPLISTASVPATLAYQALRCLVRASDLLSSSTKGLLPLAQQDALDSHLIDLWLRCVVHNSTNPGLLALEIDTIGDLIVQLARANLRDQIPILPGLMTAYSTLTSETQLSAWDRQVASFCRRYGWGPQYCSRVLPILRAPSILQSLPLVLQLSAHAIETVECHRASHVVDIVSDQLKSQPVGPSSAWTLYRCIRAVAATGHWTLAQLGLDWLCAVCQSTGTNQLWFRTLLTIASAERSMLAIHNALQPTIEQLFAYEHQLADALGDLQALTSLGYDRRFQRWYLEAHTGFKECVRRVLALYHLRACGGIADPSMGQSILTRLGQLDQWYTCLAHAFPAMQPEGLVQVESYRLACNTLTFVVRRMVFPSEPWSPHPTVARLVHTLHQADLTLEIAANIYPRLPSTPESTQLATPALLRTCAALMAKVTGNSTGNIIDGSMLLPLATIPLQLPRFWFNSPQLCTIHLNTTPRHTAPEPPLPTKPDHMFVFKVEGVLDGLATPYHAVDILSYVSTQPEAMMHDLDNVAHIYAMLTLPNYAPSLRSTCVSQPKVQRFSRHHHFFGGSVATPVPTSQTVRQFGPDQIFYLHVNCALIDRRSGQAWLTPATVTLPLAVNASIDQPSSTGQTVAYSSKH
ncbi:Integrator complex subunit 7 [Dimargaris verticillata]|uniref:Integrator complex subunit 7 n=1 Tax=Dimargaris verticillata TaxID=2761393 RepID=A0A9W8EDC0_9FUNG|nr:Integrator complex subunit 7 [Dimargaris verticillata]